MNIVFVVITFKSLFLYLLVSICLLFIHLFIFILLFIMYTIKKVLNNNMNSSGKIKQIRKD